MFRLSICLIVNVMDSLSTPRVSLRTPGPGTAIGRYLMLYCRAPSPTFSNDESDEEVSRIERSSSELALKAKLEGSHGPFSPVPSSSTAAENDASQIVSLRFRFPDKNPVTSSSSINVTEGNPI